MTYTVMVKWSDAPRAERLARGTTTTSRVHAIMLASPEDATKAAQQACAGIDGVERWWVAPF